MPAGSMEKPGTASPLAGAPASGAQTPDKPKSASEHRKSSKPIMEKRRRARINESLGQLKTLILDALKKDSSRHSKLEKADILEMAVSYLKEQSRPHSEIVPFQKHASMDFQEGYSRCFQETLHFLSAHNAQVGIHAKLVHYAQATTVEPAPKKIPSASKPVSAPTTNNTPWRPW